MKREYIYRLWRKEIYGRSEIGERDRILKENRREKEEEEKEEVEEEEEPRETIDCRAYLKPQFSTSYDMYIHRHVYVYRYL